MLERHEVQVLRRAGHTWKEIAALSGRVRTDRAAHRRGNRDHDDLGGKLSTFRTRFALRRFGRTTRPMRDLVRDFLCCSFESFDLRLLRPEITRSTELWK
jgi:hypothetical protein